MNSRKSFAIKVIIGLSFLLCGGLQWAWPVHAQVQDVVNTKDTQQVILYKGDVVTLKVFSLTRVAVTVPGIVDMGKVEAGQIMLIGQNTGQTALFIWDEYGKRKITVDVLTEDLDQMISRINNLLISADIRGLLLRKNLDEKKIVMTGKVPKDKEKLYVKVLDPFLPYLIDLTTEGGDLVQIDVQITELTTTLTKTMGILWSTGTNTGVSLSYPETLPDFEGGFSDLFKIGDFERTSAIQATVNMLLAEGKARILSKPSIIVTTGESATFLVGGEIPIRTTTVSEGNVTENITYRSYGVDLTVTPEIKGDKIDLEMEVSIRDIDASNAVGDDTAFTTRSANTRLFLDNGQTIILAGLIKSNKGEQVNRVPILSSIPIVGLLFRSKSWNPNREEEVVISLTTKILKSDKIIRNEESARLEKAGRKKYLLLEENEDLAFPGAQTFMPESGPSEMEAETARESDRKGPKEWSMPVKTPGEDFLQGVPSSQTITDYAQSVQKKISRAISFPDQAQERGWEGVVTLSLDILRDGSLVDVAVEESSGYSSLDTDAVNTAQLSAPFDPFPRDINLEEVRLTLPIIYSQEAFLDDVVWR